MALKIQPEHIEHMRVEISRVLTEDPEITSRYEAGQFAKSNMVKELQRRFCFDLMHRAGLTPFVCSEIYSYANDDNIYSALKTICPKVERKY